MIYDISRFLFKMSNNCFVMEFYLIVFIVWFFNNPMHLVCVCVCVCVCVYVCVCAVSYTHLTLPTTAEV